METFLYGSWLLGDGKYFLQMHSVNPIATQIILCGFLSAV